MEKDVVCGMQVDPAKAAGTSEYSGQTYYFCSQSCLEQFKSDPERFLNPEGVVAPASAGLRPTVRKSTCP